MAQAPTRTRIWYQSFTDPDVDAPYFARLSDYLQSLTSPGTELDVYGIRSSATGSSSE